MNVLREFVKPEPSNLVKLVRLTITDFFSVNADFEIEGYPVRRLSVVNSMNIPVTEKFIIQNIRTILFLNLFTDSLINGFTEFQPPRRRCPIVRAHPERCCYVLP